MATTAKPVHDQDAKPPFQLNIVELHVNVGFPFLLFGPIVEGSRAIERGLKNLFAEQVSDDATVPKKSRAA